MVIEEYKPWSSQTNFHNKMLSQTMVENQSNIWSYLDGKWVDKQNNGKYVQFWLDRGYNIILLRHTTQQTTKTNSSQQFRLHLGTLNLLALQHHVHVLPEMVLLDMEASVEFMSYFSSKLDERAPCCCACSRSFTHRTRWSTYASVEFGSPPTSFVDPWWLTIIARQDRRSICAWWRYCKRRTLDKSSKVGISTDSLAPFLFARNCSNFSGPRWFQLKQAVLVS
jgi:hypothetical protein